MALSEDQRALLQLLIAGDTYEQLAEVLGTSADDVRERAHAAARSLESTPEPDIPLPAVRERLSALEGAQPNVEREAFAEAGSGAGPRRWGLWAALGAAA